MMLATRPATTTDGSRTITVIDGESQCEDTSSHVDGAQPSPAVGTLRLRGARRTRSRVVAWGEDVVDNEGCGRKKSKICCIYHKPKQFDESSDSDSSGSDSDSDLDADCRHPDHNHNRDPHSRPPQNRDGATTRRNPDGGDGANIVEDVPGPNAYEKAPRSNKGKGRVRSSED